MRSERINEIQSLKHIIYFFVSRKRRTKEIFIRVHQRNNTHISDCISTMAGMSKLPAVYRHGFVLGRFVMIDLYYNSHFFLY
jgi:hypothetical protein